MKTNPSQAASRSASTAAPSTPAYPSLRLGNQAQQQQTRPRPQPSPLPVATILQQQQQPPSYRDDTSSSNTFEENDSSANEDEVTLQQHERNRSRRMMVSSFGQDIGTSVVLNMEEDTNGSPNFSGSGGESSINTFSSRPPLRNRGVLGFMDVEVATSSYATTPPTSPASGTIVLAQANRQGGNSSPSPPSISGSNSSGREPLNLSKDSDNFSFSSGSVGRLSLNHIDKSGGQKKKRKSRLSKEVSEVEGGEGADEERQNGLVKWSAALYVRVDKKIKSIQWRKYILLGVIFTVVSAAILLSIFLDDNTRSSNSSSASSTSPTAAPYIPALTPSNPSLNLPVSKDLSCGINSQCPIAAPCCSNSNFCGSDISYCGIVYWGCQSGFGLCSYQNEVNPVPAPGSYPPVSNATAGPPILHLNCVNSGDFVLGFDDGVSLNDPILLQTLKTNNVVATFFINGFNWGDITLDPFKSILLNIDSAGHHIASHTFDHLDLQTLTLDQLWSQVRRNDVALNIVLGKTPLYLRAPYGSVNDTTLIALQSWGYKVVWENILTNDTNHDAPSIPAATQLSLDVANFTYSLNISSPAANSFISLNHNQVNVTSLEFAQVAIDMVTKAGYKFVTLGECLDPTNPLNWYRPLTHV